jgi:D-alanyl-lipoteichoic acid acyltransferase DltB (MBOAT superfamily)
MLFNSLEFAVFFPLVCALYFTAPVRTRVPLLLIASCVFYMAFIPVYIFILGVTIGIDYVAGIMLERVQDGRKRRLVLLGSIIATCAVLFIFKYYNFFVGSFVGVATYFGWHPTNPSLSIILPIGLSFHTFQSLSYVVEVYRGKQRAEHNFVVYATYVMFFPQLVAGPIERPQNLLHQFYERHEFEYARIVSGLKRMAWGFFKKLVIADRLAIYVNDVYGDPQGHGGLQLAIATVFFAYQIYCDFSGYSDIAIGSARILGFKLMENFDTPYASRSVSEFWRRWHISLSTWFRDYVYYPMGGNRVSKPRWYTNLLITFGVSGLWHGANWTYVVWGLLNGLYLVVGAATGGARTRLAHGLGLADDGRVRIALQIVLTFTLTCIAWVIFRAHSIADAIYILTHMFTGWDFSQIRTEQFLMRQMPIALAAIVFLEVAQYLHRHRRPMDTIARWPRVARWPVYASLVVAVLLLGIYRQSAFIYFQF